LQYKALVFGSYVHDTSWLRFPYENLTLSLSLLTNPVPIIEISVPPKAGPHLGEIENILIGA